MQTAPDNDSKDNVLDKSGKAVLPSTMTIGGLSIPVYGHLLTADQLDQIERRKELLGLQTTSAATDDNLTSTIASVSSTTNNKFLGYANVTTVASVPNEADQILYSQLSSNAGLISPHNLSRTYFSSPKSSSRFTKTTDPISSTNVSASVPYYHYPDLNTLDIAVNIDCDHHSHQSHSNQHNQHQNHTTNAQNLPSHTLPSTTTMITQSNNDSFSSYYNLNHRSSLLHERQQKLHDSNNVKNHQQKFHKHNHLIHNQMHLDQIKLPRCIHPHFIVKLSVDLIKTYKNINEVYYRKKRRIKEPGDENYLKRDCKRNSLNGSEADSTSLLLTNDLQHSFHHTSNSRCNELQQFNNNKLLNTNVLNSSSAGNVHLNIPISTTLSSSSNNNNFITDYSNENRKVNSNLPRQQILHSQNTSLSDHGGYEYVIKPGEIWKNQYCIDKLIGTGSFGQVVRAKDLKTGESVAIKIIKNKRNFVEQAYIEISLLREIGKYQETDELAQQWGANYIVKLKSYFNHRGHLCLVFELLTYTLYELLKNTNFRGVSLNLTRKFAQQICQAMVFLAKPQIQIIHCDLKPENILLVHPRRSAIKVVDLGSSCHANRRIYYYIQSRFYRSPEIILNLEYSHAIDMWSLGCIMAELHTGQPLFVGQFEHEQILKIIEVVGMPPSEMIEKGKKGTRYFEKVPSTTSVSKYIYSPKLYREKDGKKISFRGVNSRNLADIIGGPQLRRVNESGHSSGDYDRFLDLLRNMLVIDPSKRIKPDEALRHPFFMRSGQTVSHQAQESNISKSSKLMQPTGIGLDNAMEITTTDLTTQISDVLPTSTSSNPNLTHTQNVGSTCSSALVTSTSNN